MPTGRKIHNNFGNFSNNSILLKCTMILGTKYIVQYLYVIQLVYSMYFYFCFDLQERESWSKTKIALKCIKEIVVIVEAESFAAACRHQKLYFRGRPDDDFFFAGLNFFGYVKVHTQYNSRLLFINAVVILEYPSAKILVFIPATDCSMYLVYIINQVCMETLYCKEYKTYLGT